MNTVFNLSEKIYEILEKRGMSKVELGRAIGMSQSNAVYLTSRSSIDVVKLQRIGNALRYNFFKHYPVAEDVAPGEPTEEQRMVAELKLKIAEQEKLLGDAKRDMDVLKQENGYLKEINELLKKK